MYKIQREKMVQKQLIERGITDKRVIDVFLCLERHNFVEESLWERAYHDSPLPIGKNQTISQPYIVALMSEHLQLTGHEKVLEIGTGSGFQAAVLSKLTDRVFSVERHKELAQKARSVFAKLNIENVNLRIGDGTIGWQEYAPYDRIIVTAGAPAKPETLTKQLSDGGILVIPIGESKSQTLYKFTRNGDEIIKKSLGACSFVPLIGVNGWKV